MRKTLRKKLLLVLTTMLFAAVIALTFTACGKGGSNATGGNNSGNAAVPTAAQVVQARTAETNKSVQGYDFTLHFGGTVSIAGFSGTANANYTGQYRYDSEQKLTMFKRTTSGALLYDSTEYVKLQNDNKLKIITDESGTVKRAYALPSDEQELTLVNLPFVAIFDSLKENNIINIKKADSASSYEYTAQMNFSSSNSIIQNAINFLGSLDTNLKIKSVKFTNIAKIPFYFNLKDDMLSDFTYRIELSFPVKGLTVNFTLDYTQHGSDTPLNIPSTNDFITDSATIASDVSNINNMIQAVKASESYSVDMTAKNEFDPGWNKLAIVDSYTAKMYKNTTADGRVDFNNSFKYKTHHEEDGQEAYKFACANLQNGTTYLKLFTGKNRVDEITTTADEQFDFLTTPIYVVPNNVACIKKKTSGGTTTYEIYLNKAAVKTLQEDIVDIINSNNEEGVVDVENYFNNDNTVKDAYIEVVTDANGVVSVKCVTELKYYPVGSPDYEDCNITLNNTVEIKFNADASKAAAYVAPTKAEALLGGDIKYIL